MDGPLSVHVNCKLFKMKIEADSILHFLDVLVTQKHNQKLGHTVYWKPTHTDRYLHKNSNHHPRQITGIITTLTERALHICEPEKTVGSHALRKNPKKMVILQNI